MGSQTKFSEDLIWKSGATPTMCTYSMNSTNGLGVNTECIPTSFLQSRPGWLSIYPVEKHLRAAVKDTYPGYMTEMTWQTHVRVGISPHYNKTTVEYPPEIESHSNKIKSCNYERLEIESY
jgi:hypothetical protein